MTEKIKIMEWNLHGMTGYNSKGQRDYYFPSELIIKNIKRFNPDVIVFTEFCAFRFDDNWNDFGKSESKIHNNGDAKLLESWLKNNEYMLIYNNFDYTDESEFRWNGVGIAVREKYNPNGDQL